MHQVFLDICDVPHIDGDHLDWFKPGRVNQLPQHGMRREFLTLDQGIALQQQNPDYAWVTVVRNPFERALSNYFNKMNVFCKAYHPSVYYYGKLRKLLRGPSAWRYNQHSLAAMRDQLSFDQTLQTLVERGTDFDDHFTPQTNHIGFGNITFDHVLRVDKLNEQLPQLLDAYGLKQAKKQVDSSVPRKNTSRYGKDRDQYFTEEAIRLIRQLYAEDFANFGYDTQYQGQKSATQQAA